MAGKSPEEKEVKLELVPSLEPKLGRSYSNFVQISHSPFDFTIRFCDAPSLSDAARLKKPGNKVEIPNIVEVIIAPNLMPNLIEALKINYEKYLKQSKEKTDEPNR